MSEKHNRWISHYYSLFRSIKLYFKASWISILIILIVMLLLTQMGQGSTIVIDLFNRPSNVLLLILLTLSLAMVISHYPDYLEKNMEGNNHLSTPGDDKGVFSWEMPIKLGCFGLIIYKEFKQAKKLAYLRRFDLLKRLQGVILFWGVIYILLSTYKIHINPNLKLNLWNLLFLVFAVGFYFSIYKLKKNRKNKRFLAIFCAISFWVKVLVGAACVLFSYLYGWNPITFYAMILYFTLAVVWYSLFRNLRFNLQFYKFTRPLNLLSNNQNFLMVMSFFGWVSLLIFVLAQIKIFWFNPIIIILTLLYTTYGLVIHPIKHKLFYAHALTEKTASTKCRMVKYASLFLVPISFLVFIFLLFVSIKYGNELHKLHPVIEHEVVKEAAFKEKMYKQLASQKDSTIYFIASYGGGLTANAWNSILLDTLSNFNGKNILQSTVAMSGVSGGAMGQGIYSAIYKTHKSKDDRKETITHIDNTNFLSLDIAWMFGWDFVREWLIHKDSLSANRAKKSLFEYERLVQDKTMSKLAFRTYWAQLFNSEPFYPALIVNTTSTHSTRGVSCSIKLDHFQNVFPGADNILEHGKNLSLSYTDALSTSNRFPMLSPAAKIEGYGHYVDGGYFENSGMLSLYNFYQYLSADSLWSMYLGNHKVVFIQIMNSKSDWIHELLEDKERIVKKTQESGEVAAVINTITSIDKFPRYFNALLKTEKNLFYVPIALPYQLQRSDFDQVFRAQELTINLDSLILKRNNHLQKVRSEAGNLWQTAEPPLARLLSPPAFRYMQAVKENGGVFNELNAVIAK